MPRYIPNSPPLLALLGATSRHMMRNHEALQRDRDQARLGRRHVDAANSGAAKVKQCWRPRTRRAALDIMRKKQPAPEEIRSGRPWEDKGGIKHDLGRRAHNRALIALAGTGARSEAPRLPCRSVAGCSSGVAAPRRTRLGPSSRRTRSPNAAEPRTVLP